MANQGVGRPSNADSMTGKDKVHAESLQSAPELAAAAVT